MDVVTPPPSARRVLVTGGAGFIGSHLVDALLERGDEVRVLDDFSTGRRDRLNPPAELAERLEVLRGDVRDDDACSAAVTGCDAVAHLAAVVSVPRSVQEPAETIAVNLVGTARLLAAAEAAGVDAFVLASTCAIYGDATHGCSEDAPPDPGSPYAASKLAAEHQVALAASKGLAASSLRYFNVYGPGQSADSGYAAVLPAFVRSAVEGRALFVHGDGRQTRDFVHVRDVVRANLAALDGGPSVGGASYNVGTGASISIAELASRVVTAAGTDVATEHGDARTGDVRYSTADLTRVRHALGWSPRVSLAEGLRELVELARS